MPFKSPQQRKFLFAKKPEVAKKFAAHEDGPKKMVKKMKSRMSSDGKMKY